MSIENENFKIGDSQYSYSEQIKEVTRQYQLNDKIKPLYDALMDKYSELRAFNLYQNMRLTGNRRNDTYFDMAGSFEGIAEIELGVSHSGETIHFYYTSQYPNEPNNKFAIIEAIDYLDSDKVLTELYDKIMATIQLVIDRVKSKPTAQRIGRGLRKQSTVEVRPGHNTKPYLYDMLGGDAMALEFIQEPKYSFDKPILKLLKIENGWSKLNIKILDKVPQGNLNNCIDCDVGDFKIHFNSTIEAARIWIELALGGKHTNIRIKKNKSNYIQVVVKRNIPTKYQTGTQKFNYISIELNKNSYMNVSLHSNTTSIIGYKELKGAKDLTSQQVAEIFDEFSERINQYIK